MQLPNKDVYRLCQSLAAEAGVPLLRPEQYQSMLLDAVEQSANAEAAAIAILKNCSLHRSPLKIEALVALLTDDTAEGEQAVSCKAETNG
jgi:hypothetical protein